MKLDLSEEALLCVPLPADRAGADAPDAADQFAAIQKAYEVCEYVRGRWCTYTSASYKLMHLKRAQLQLDSM
jgi:hypothetical protein